MVNIGYAWNLPLNVDVFEIKFNHGGTGSAVTIKVNYSTPIAIPEYRSGSLNEKFAYTISTTPTVKVKLTAFPPDDPALTIGAASTDSTWNLSPVAVTFNGSGISIGDNGFVSFSTQTGRTIPSSVGTPSVEWEWKVNAIGNTQQTPAIDIGSTSHSYYTLLASPSSFEYNDMEYGVPWTEVLDFACEWASGESTSLGCIDALTTELYGFQGVQYDEFAGTYDFGENQLYLKSLLDDINSHPTPVPSLDCTGYANFLCLLAYSIGMSCDSYSGTGYIRIKRDGWVLDPPETINLNQLLPAYEGKYSTPPDIGPWNYHQVVYFYDANQYDNFIADPAARAYNNGNPVLSKGNVTYVNYLQYITTDSDIIRLPSIGRGKARVKPE